MITNSMFIKCLVLIVILVYANKCSGVMYLERSARVGKILNRNQLLRSKFTMKNYYIPTEDHDLSPTKYDPKYLEIIKNKSADKTGQILTEKKYHAASVQYHPLPITTARKNYTQSAQLYNSSTETNNNKVNSQQNDSNVTTNVVVTETPIYNIGKVTETSKTTTDASTTTRKYLQHSLITLIINKTSEDAKRNLTILKNVTELNNSTMVPKKPQCSAVTNEIDSITEIKNDNVTEINNSTTKRKKPQCSALINENESITGIKNDNQDAKTTSNLKNVTDLNNSTEEARKTQGSAITNEIESINGNKNDNQDAETKSSYFKNVTELNNSTEEARKTQGSAITNKIESINGIKKNEQDAKTISNSNNVTELNNSTTLPKKPQCSAITNEIASIIGKTNDNQIAKTKSSYLKNVTELDNSQNNTEEAKKSHGSMITNQVDDKSNVRKKNDSLQKFDEKKFYATIEEMTSKTPIYKKSKEKKNVSKNTTDNYLQQSLISLNIGKLLAVNTTRRSNSTREPKGFFVHGGLFALPKVLNFFPVGGERECQPQESTVARAGICLNPYDCRQRDGAAGGDCAHGLGVCCVFEVTCGGVAANNLTYFKSPGFPELWAGDKECSITIEKAFAGIMQLRIDFVHFTIGQPNRLTGECDEDALILGEGTSNFTLCGQNHGQHIYYTLPTASEKREAGELPTIKNTKLNIRMRGGDMPRLWLLRIAQLPLVNSAPHNCLQYFTSNNGTIKTFNFASNGRHLASQEYRACIRRNNGYCAIRYSPCDPRSFRIGGTDGQDPNSDVGALQGTIRPPSALSTTPRVSTVSVYQQTPSPGLQNDTLQQDQMMEANGTMQDEVEGSGMDPEIENASTVQKRPPPAKAKFGFWESIWSYMLPSWLWGQGRDSSRSARSFPVRWSPYIQHYKSSPENDDFRYYGYGTFGLGFHGFGRQACEDRITIPCESEYFVSSTSYGPGVCDPHHCGSSFCPRQHHDQCRVETSITPFAVSVHFGPPVEKRSPEENIGACLKFQQVSCDD